MQKLSSASALMQVQHGGKKCDWKAREACACLPEDLPWWLRKICARMFCTVFHCKKNCKT